MSSSFPNYATTKKIITLEVRSHDNSVFLRALACQAITTDAIVKEKGKALKQYVGMKRVVG